MNEIYNKSYYENYDVDLGKISYENSTELKAHLGAVAKRIAEDLAPKTVLDAGCAMGHLVAALRDLGVEAYGIDISEYAISKVREDIKPYCAVASLDSPLPENFPNCFDLVFNHEVIEHLREEECLPAIKKLCSYTDRIIFSSTPDDVSDPTHFNVQQPEYWARQFAKFGFYNQVNYVPSYISGYAVYFERRQDIPKVVEDYERSRRILSLEMEKRLMDIQLGSFVSSFFFNKGQGFCQEDSISVTTKGNDFYQEIFLPQGVQSVRFDPLDGHGCVVQSLEIFSNVGKIEYTNLNGYQINGYHIFVNTDPQFLIDFVGQPVQWLKVKANIYPVDDFAFIGLFSDISGMLQENKVEIDRYHIEIDRCHGEIDRCHGEIDRCHGEIDRCHGEIDRCYGEIGGYLKSTSWKMTAPFRKLANILKRAIKKVPLLYKVLASIKSIGLKATIIKTKNHMFRCKSAKKIAPQYLLASKDRQSQKNALFTKKIKFSILVPLYNTPITFLKEMIDSVIDQTYQDWELCLADGSDSSHSEAQRICEHYADKNPRIKYQKLIHNGGISENTNKCAEMATGDYVALLDHDDMLHPSALFEVMRAIEEQSADFIYTDENTFKNHPSDAYCPHFKPDFSPDTLRSYNYICHLSVFQRELLDTVGYFRSECDGSQDYDMVLRLTEKAKKIVHIPKILYYWRAHDASVALDVSAKSYVLDAAKKALAGHLRRVGLTGVVEDSLVPSTYKIKYSIVNDPLVSILIPNKDNIDDLGKCLQSIFYNTSYNNYEIVVIENNSQSQITFDYYEKIKIDKRVKVINWLQDFNFSAINDFGAGNCCGEYLLFLNNDTEVISPDWIQEMLMFAQRSDIGAVGAKLYYPDDTVQHAGVILGIGGVGGHSHKYFNRRDSGYMMRLSIAQNLSAVTAACMMMPRRVFDEVGGFDDRFKVAFNDVDLCMRIRKAGYLIVFTPYSELYHYESKTRGYEDTDEKKKRFQNEIFLFKELWDDELNKGDPYYNPNFTLEKEDFSFR